MNDQTHSEPHDTPIGIRAVWSGEVDPVCATAGAAS
jgi:hypothetical protein